MFIYKGESCIPGEKTWIQEKNEKVPGRDFLVLITGIYKGLILSLIHICPHGSVFTFTLPLEEIKITNEQIE